MERTTITKKRPGMAHSKREKFSLDLRVFSQIVNKAFRITFDRNKIYNFGLCTCT